jgi:hypothetical protein
MTPSPHLPKVQSGRQKALGFAEFCGPSSHCSPGLMMPLPQLALAMKRGLEDREEEEWLEEWEDVGLKEVGTKGGRAGLRGLQMIQGSVEVEVQVAACALQKSDPPFWHSVPLQAFVVELVELAENSEAAR